MRASEFITERANKPTKRQRYASVGMMTFTNSKNASNAGYDRTYDLNRLMMAVASTDGKNKPTFDNASWAAKLNTAHPYTEVEQNMLEIAFNSVGIPFEDLNKGDLKSDELPTVQKDSPIKAFKGYPR
jgi:hypothetical protein